MNLFYATRIFYSQSLTIVLTNGTIYLVMLIFRLRAPNLAVFALLTGSQLIMAYIWFRISKFLILWYSRDLKAAVLYSETGEIDRFVKDQPMHFRSDLRFIELSDSSDKALDGLRGIDVVYSTSLPLENRKEILAHCLEHKIMFFFKPEISEVILAGAKPVRGFNNLILGIPRFDSSVEFKVVKRFMDLALSSIALILFSPFMLITALAIHLQDGGPALYRQTRLTKDGKPFTMYKFRSMRVDAEKDGQARLASENDDRITAVGRIVRMIRFDELPQLFNILRGDMAIVGPRPERPEIMDQYIETLPEFPLRLQVKAGLTGFAQIYGRYDSTPEDKLNLDLYYIGHPSIINEVRIMVATVKILFMKESTRGVAQGQITADRELNPQLKRSPGKEQ